MKKRLILAGAVLALLLGGAAVHASGLTSSDALISLRYLTDTFLPSLTAQTEERLEPLDDAYQQAADALDEKAALYLAQAGVTGSSAVQYSGQFSRTSFGQGDVLTLPTGAGFLLLEGSVQVAHDGAVVDVTTGSSVSSGTALAANHRYLVGEETTARFTILSGAASAGVEGYYLLTSSQEASLPFLDVTVNDWFYSAVSFVYENGLFSGTAADTFSPNMNITRGMVVTVLYQLAGRPAVSGNSGFSDVAPDAYYALPVAWASANGVVAGMGNNEFAPNSNITREQLACMLYSYARSIAGADVSARGDLTQYVDFSQVSSYAQEALSWAVGAGVITGMDAQTLSPGGTATRAQAAAMLQVLSSLL